MISPDSRYRDSTTTLVSSNRGVHLTVVPSAPSDWVFDFTYYRWRADDRLDLLPHSFYGDPRLWWMLADGNPEILDWTSLKVGQIIRVPSA